MQQLNPVLHAQLKVLSNVSPFSLLLHQMTRDACHNRSGQATIVELGTNGGDSTLALATAVMGYPKSLLHSCDTVSCHLAAENVSNAGAEHWWLFTQIDSIAFAEQFLDNSVHLIFLDTDHEYENTCKELATWTPKLAPSSKLLLHDTCTAYDRVGRAVAEFCASNPTWSYYNIDVECGLGVLTKPSS
jgi:hypothetical protein